MRGVDVIIAGGGPAGLSSALVLARARRKVLVVDAGEPRNASSYAVHGLLGQEGICPADLARNGRAEVIEYGGAVIRGSVVDVEVHREGFAVSLDTAEVVSARVVLIATGAVDGLPDIPGLRERWGRDVIHCGYCHGWEIRDSRVGILSTGPDAPMNALMFRQWSRTVAYFAHEAGLAAADEKRLAMIGVPVHTSPVAELRVVDDRLEGVRLHNGEVVRLDALVVAPVASPNLLGFERLGLTSREPEVDATPIADASGKTSVPGVWAVGNVVQSAQQVSEAIAHGARVAMHVNAELTIRDANAEVLNRQLRHD